MNKIFSLAIGLFSICYSTQSFAQENTPITKEKSSSIFSLNAFAKEGDYDETRFFLTAKIGASIAPNNWIGLNISYDKQKTVVGYSPFNNETHYKETKFYSVGGFYRIKYPIADRFYFTNDLEVNVLIDVDNGNAPKPIQGAIAFNTEFNPNESIGIRLGLGHLSVVNVQDVTLIDFNYLFNAPSVGLVLYF